MSDMASVSSVSSTLPPEPSYNANIPIISSAGGTKAAYADPNSPESIMKKTTLLNAQTAVDTKYDVNPATVTTLNEKEGFCWDKTSMGSTLFKPVYILYIFVILLLGILILRKKARVSSKLFLLAVAVLCIIGILIQNGRQV
jgi:hypothetical protein